MKAESSKEWKRFYSVTVRSGSCSTSSSNDLRGSQVIYGSRDILQLEVQVNYMTYSNPTPPFRSLITEILTPCLKTFEYNNMQESNSKYKTVICRHFTDKGYCSMKEKCHFAHGEKELRFASDPVPSNISVQLKPVSIYKTQLCKYYAKGYCKNAEECTYAHGAGDIQSMPVVPAGENKQMLAPIPINCPSPVYPMYMVPMMMPVMPAPPPMNPNINNMLTIIQNLHQVFRNNEGVFMQLRGAGEYAVNGDIDSAKQIINQILNDPSRTVAEKEKIKKIMSNMMFLSSLNTIKSPFLNSNYDI